MQSFTYALPSRKNVNPHAICVSGIARARTVCVDVAMGSVPKRVSKVMFVSMMLLLAEVDPERYRELRARGWAQAAADKSDAPN